MRAALLLLAARRDLGTLGFLGMFIGFMGLDFKKAKLRSGHWRWLTRALPMQRLSSDQKASVTFASHWVGFSAKTI